MLSYYTGIGSRKTPLPHLAEMRTIAAELAQRGYVLRSGGADGADLAFEQGCDEVQGKKQIYLPWRNFNNNKSALYKIPVEAFHIAAKVHPAWSQLRGVVRRLHARNVLQVLGEDLQTPSKFVICWTLDGACVGGTATAIKLAQQHNIRVINLALEDFSI